MNVGCFGCCSCQRRFFSFLISLGFIGGGRRRNGRRRRFELEIDGGRERERERERESAHREKEIFFSFCFLAVLLAAYRRPTDLSFFL